MPRADLLLVAQGLAPSRTAAQHLIANGRVHWDEFGRWVAVAKASQSLPEGVQLRVTPDPADRYVSRGGLKLAGALAHTGLSVTGLHALDVGISTGGFTDCLLQDGAARVVGVDVGHGQLAARLGDDPRVLLREGMNARQLDAAELLPLNDGQPFDLAVMDVSFISQTLVLPVLAPLLKPGGLLISLVKPQFEVGREGVSKGGIVRDPALYAGVQERVTESAREAGFTPLNWFDSPIAGGDGNREFFLYARRD